MSRPEYTSQHVNLAIDYCESVVSKEILACKLTILACERFLSDLDEPPLDYHFDEAKADRVCKMFELLPHVKGNWPSPTLVLQGWQAFIFCSIFGWVDDSGNRRFKTAYIEIPRKNAKTTCASVIGLACLTLDDEPGAEIYSAATTRDQAKISWDIAKEMVSRSSGLKKRFGLDVMAHAITRTGLGSSFKSLSADANTLDGLNIHCAVVDELHAHKTRHVWDVLEGSTAARTQPLQVGISTAGFNRASVCYEVRRYLTKILQRVHVDEEFFGVIYTIDDDDDWTDERVWEKANPGWNVSVKPEDFRRKARKAMQMASAQNTFLTKQLNVWVNAGTAWMDMLAWERCADKSLCREDFRHEECITALDLATKRDIAARLDVFRREIDGKHHYYVFGKYYLPEETVENSNNSQYSGWEIDGRLIATEGNITDFDVIRDDLIQDRGFIYKIAYDNYQAMMLITQLQKANMDLVEVPQQVTVLSEPMKELEALVHAGRIHHDGCPVLTWMISNVIAHMDVKENIYPRKEAPDNKIDGAVALITALALWMRDGIGNKGPSIYETRDMSIL